MKSSQSSTCSQVQRGSSCPSRSIGFGSGGATEGGSIRVRLSGSYQLAVKTDGFTARMLEALNGMMLDMLASIARKDYEDRRRRAAQGLERAKAEGLYKGRRPNEERNAGILAMLDSGLSWSQICAATGASRSTLSRLNKQRNG